MAASTRMTVIFPNSRNALAAQCRSSTVVTKKDVNFTDSVQFNGREPVIRGRKAPWRGAFDARSAQAISATHYFDLAARDYSLADGAIELLVEGVPCSASIQPSQRSELIFYGRSDRLRGRKHGVEGGKSGRDLQGHNVQMRLPARPAKLPYN